jgi:hypothetical protein
MEEWRDKRSGPAGCFAGNLVLQHLQNKYGGPIVREKGTIFGTSKRVYVGRVANDGYLAGAEKHICNISPRQQRQVAARAGRREVYYLFIALAQAARPSVHFWLIPARVVARVTDGLPVKDSDKSCFVRITESRGKYRIGRVDVTRYHGELPLSRADARKLVELAGTARDESAVPDVDADDQACDDASAEEESVPVEIRIGGQRYEGTMRRTG